MSSAANMAPAANEEILWQSPAGAWARLAAGGRYANLTRGEVLVMISGGVLGLILTLMSGGGRGEAGASNLLPLLFGVVGTVWIFGYLVFYVGYNRVSGITLTDCEIRHAIGFPWPRHETILRADVRSVVVYEGDGTAVLLGEAGELLRTRHLAGATAFAEALGAPTVAWPSRPGGDPHLWALYMAFWLGLATLPAFFVTLYVFDLFGSAFIFLHDGPVEPSETVATIAILIAIVGAFLLLTFGLAMALAMFLAIAAGRFLFKREPLSGLLHTMSGGPLHWGGRPDWARTAGRPRLTARYTLWCARIVGIAAPADPVPDLRAGMAREMSRTALALAEGTA